MKIYHRNRRPVWVLFSGIVALLFVVALVTLLPRFSALAEPDAAFTVQKTVNTALAGPGDRLTYTIKIQSSGAVVYGAWLTDTLADELDIVGSVTANYGTLGVVNDVITWTGDLGTALITFSVQISPAIGSATIVNTAEVTGSGELHTDSAATQVSPGNLVASKSVYPASAHAGGQLAYTVRITNTGNGTVGAAQMSDVLPSQVDYAGNLNATSGSWGEAGDVITWAGSLGPAESVTVTFDAAIVSSLSDEVTFTNTAQITGAGTLVIAPVEATAFTTFTTWFPIIFSDYPPILTLDHIPTPGNDNSYRVSWSAVDTDPQHDGYVLQEATDPDFTENLQQWTSYTAYRDITKGTAIGTYYYRVRVDDADRWGQGPWSNVESVSFGFYDDFSNSSSGWPRREVLVIPETDTHYRLRYEYGHYRIMVDAGGPPIWFHQPDAFAPYRPPNDKYCVETKIRFMKNQPPYDNSAWDYYPYWANAGLVFGANEANSNLYAVCLSVGAGGNLGWFIVNNPTYSYPYKGCNYVDGVVGGESAGSLATEVWHRFQVSVDGNWASVYIDGTHKGTWNMSGLGGTTRVGLIGGDYEVTPVDIRFDNFRVVPNVSCAP